jgi:hypothetical protein
MRPEEFLEADLEQFEAYGISLEEIEAQLSLLRTPPPPIVLDRPCTIGDGITQLHRSDYERLLATGNQAAASGRVTKFVPASGAATRMFKDLIAALQGDERPSSLPAVHDFLASLDLFPFGAELRQRSGVMTEPESEAEERAMLRTLLEDMQCAALPKGLVPFHRAEQPRTAFEEHLLEGTRYARASDGTSRMHFTVGRDVRDRFETALRELAPAIERQSDARLVVTFSEQRPSTDTIALDDSGRPFRAAAGQLLLRPSGHGALLRNLQDTDGDIVVIKNIDNVVPDERSSEVVRWKRLLIGLLASVQEEVFQILAECQHPGCSEPTLDRAIAFARERFARVPTGALTDAAARREFVWDALDRPLRICGVVRNEGEPGGAPFWVRGTDGRISVQIVESSQVNAQDARQQQIFMNATHFNPVDLVCGLKNWVGLPFQLDKFVDPSMVFLSSKSHEGRELRALERPGLWNGAMAGWNTICVEVPAETFAPVKTVLDLLRPQHQSTSEPIPRATP